jgi:hypothetical protein
MVDYKQNPNPRGGNSTNASSMPGWAIPAAIGGVVLVAAFLIFGSGGPDRTRTVDNANQPSAVTTPGPTTGEQVPARTPVPSKSNTSGTQ